MLFPLLPVEIKQVENINEKAYLDLKNKIIQVPIFLAGLFNITEHKLYTALAKFYMEPVKFYMALAKFYMALVKFDMAHVKFYTSITEVGQKCVTTLFTSFYLIFHMLYIIFMYIYVGVFIFP